MITEEIKMNLRPIDLEVIFKFIPDDLKRSILDNNDTLSSIRDCVDMLATALEKKRDKRKSELRQAIKKDHWGLVRWGQGPDLGKTFLGVFKNVAQGENVAFWCSKGQYIVPLWWVEHVYEYAEIEPVKRWSSPVTPDLPENHPVKSQPLKSWLEKGYYESLDNRAVAIAQAALAYMAWSQKRVTLEARLLGLLENQVAALYYHAQEKRKVKEKGRLEKMSLSDLPLGTWLSVKPDGSKSVYEVVLLGYFEKEGFAYVWNPDDDENIRIFSYWIERVLSSKPRVTIKDGDVSEADRFQYSEPYRLHKIKTDAESNQEKLSKYSIEKARESLKPWEPFWLAHQGNLHRVVQERCRSLCNWFQRWTDPIKPNDESYSSLEYDEAYPLKAKVVLSYVSQGHLLERYVRAEVDLFEGTVKCRDQAIRNSLTSIL